MRIFVGAVFFVR